MELSDPELTQLLNDFDQGKIPLMVFMRMVAHLKEKKGEIESKDFLGKAVVGSFGRHTEGRDLMACLLEANGFSTIIAERDSTVQQMVGMCMDPEVTVLCISVQTTYDCPDVFDTSDLLTEAGIRDRIVFNIGGSPINEDLAAEAGSDVYSHTAAESIRLIKAEVLRRKTDGSDQPDS